MSSSALFGSMLRELILPPGLLFLLIAIGLLLRLRWRRLGTTVSGTSLLLLLVFSTTAGARLLVAPLENLTAPLRSPRHTDAEAIVVLAAGRLERAPEYGDQDIPDYVALGRLRYAAKLHRETGLPILVSGGNRRFKNSTVSKANDMERALREEFSTPVKWIEGQSDNTGQNAYFSTTILKRDGIRKIFLVTDAMHMARAKRVFELFGVEVIAAPTMFFSAPELGPFSFLPSAEGMRRTWYASHEWVGIIYYMAHEKFY